MHKLTSTPIVTGIRPRHTADRLVHEMTKQQAVAAIAEAVQKAQDALSQAEIISDQHNLGFHFDPGVYGMGGYYDGESGEWNASSQSC